MKSNIYDGIIFVLLEYQMTHIQTEYWTITADKIEDFEGRNKGYGLLVIDAIFRKNEIG